MSRYKGPSEAQTNAEALARRESPYTAAHAVSVSLAWDYRARQPNDLRDAERMVRRAYADEIPTKLHEGPDSIGEGGTPKMTARAEGYLFGHADSSDARRNPTTGEPDLISYYHAPFRATLDAMAHSSRESHRRHAAIVSHVTIGQQTAVQAAIAEGVPSWCAGTVAERALRGFLAQLSDVKIASRRVTESVTAA